MSDLVLRSELSRARAHLLYEREWLRQSREWSDHAYHQRLAEDRFLAALCWVWEEQERERDPGFILYRRSFS